MSRIGKVPVPIPSGVTVEIASGEIRVKGAKGALTAALHPLVTVSQTDGSVVVAPANDSGEARAMWGMTRSVVRNLVEGVSKGYTRRLEIQGVGYRAAIQGNVLSLTLGFSHEIRYMLPDEVKATVDKNTIIELTSADKQKVGQIAAEIRNLKKPEPYKGKGIRYDGEYVRRKEGKKK